MSKRRSNRPGQSEQFAALLYGLRQGNEAIELLIPDLLTQSDGEEAQLFYPLYAEESIRGWKIAATSAGGQNAINVDGPLEGPYLYSNTHESGATISMQGNRMAVAEAEFAFEFARDLPPKDTPYSQAEIVDAIDTLRPSLELPDSRLKNFREVSLGVLLADSAASRDCILGAPTEVDWRSMDLARCRTELIINGEVASEATGADALGHPLIALEWLVNRLSDRGIVLKAGNFVTTGVCGLPMPIKAGDTVESRLVDFGSAVVNLID